MRWELPNNKESEITIYVTFEELFDINTGLDRAVFYENHSKKLEKLINKIVGEDELRKSDVDWTKKGILDSGVHYIVKQFEKLANEATDLLKNM